MKIESEELLKKIDEFCEYRKITVSNEEKINFKKRIEHELDCNQILSFDQFIDLLTHNEELDAEAHKNLIFNDEIEEITEVGEIEMLDFNISGNRLFYVNNILTHNSATNNTEDADNSNVSDSMGTVMTSDFMLFLLQNEEMKERKEIVCKCTKNRFTGRTDTWIMSVDYEHMRFADMLVQGNNTSIDEINTAIDMGGPKIDEDFGIITAEKQENAEEFGKSEIRDILHEDFEKVKEFDSKHSKESVEKDPFSGDALDDLYNELGI